MKVTLLGLTLAIYTDAQKKKSSYGTPVAPSGLTQGTPMTDAEVKNVLQSGHHEKVKAEFARQLERKLYEYQRNNGQHQVVVR